MHRSMISQKCVTSVISELIITSELLRVKLWISVQPAQNFLCANYLEKGVKHECILFNPFPSPQDLQIVRLCI